MNTMHWILLAALATETAAAPATEVDRLKVDLTDADVSGLAHYPALRDLTLTGPYDSGW